MTQHTSSRELTRRILLGEMIIIEKESRGGKPRVKLQTSQKMSSKIPYMKNWCKIKGRGGGLREEEQEDFTVLGFLVFSFTIYRVTYFIIFPFI